MKLALLLFYCVFTFNQVANGQFKIWEYQFESETQSVANDLWVDENGQVHITYAVPRPNNYWSTQGILTVNQDGTFHSVISTNYCDRGQTFLPFSDGKYMMTSSLCGYQGMVVFDQFGKVLETRPGFEGNIFSEQYTDDGYFMFHKPLNQFSATEMQISRIDWKLKRTDEAIDLSSMQKGELGIANNYIDPTRTANGTWIVPFQYGERAGQGLKLKHGSVIGIAQSKIQWQYPDTLNHTKVVGLYSEENQTLVLFDQRQRGRAKAVILDDQGNSLRQIYIPSIRGVKDLAFDGETIYILTKWSVSQYDLEGTLIGDINLNEEHSIQGSRLWISDQSTFYVAGKKSDRAVIAMFSFDPVASNVDTVLKSEAQLIRSAQIDEFISQSISVSAYPNPATLFIRFELKESVMSEFEIQIFALSGKQVHRDVFSGNQYEFDVQQLIAGTYVFVIQSRDGRRIGKGKFVKI